MTAALPPCRRCGSAIEAGDLRCPVCHLAVPHDAGPAEPVTRVHVFRCPSCGPAMEYRARVQAPQCAFCGGTVRLEEPVDPIEQTEAYLPFTVDREAAIAACRAWLSQPGFFRPSNLASAARLDSLRPLWWAAWAVSGEAVVTWTADSNAGARRAAWAPHAGEFQTGFKEMVIPATRGLTPAECVALVPTYDPASSASEPSGAGPDTTIERFETSRRGARGQIVQAMQRLAEARITGGEAPGDRFRNVHASVHLRALHTRRLAFPAYAMAYQYRGRRYRTVISGQDATCIVGQLPRSHARLVLLIVLVLAGLAAGVIALLRRVL